MVRQNRLELPAFRFGVLLLPGEGDFGIAAVEARARRRPAIRPGTRRRA